MMPKTQRKEALRKLANTRAARYLNECAETGLSVPCAVAQAYEDGYRAAMRDARAAWNSEETHVMATDALLRFLRPIR